MGFSLLFLILFYFKYIFKKISIDETIELLKKELRDTQVTEIINKLHWKYHDDYWLIIIRLYILNKKIYDKYPDFNVNIKELNLHDKYLFGYDDLPKKIRLRIIMSYINKILKEEKQYKKRYTKKFNIKDTSVLANLRHWKKLKIICPAPLIKTIRILMIKKLSK